MKGSIVSSRFLIAALAAGLAVFSGCGKDIQNKEAVKQGVMDYLAKRSDLMAMDVNVESVSFRNGEANAAVHFQAKGVNNSAAGMSITYVLEKKGSQWVVKGRSGGLSGAPHTGAQASPEGAGGTALPPGHPTVAPPENLPPGHPSITPQGTPPAGGAAPALPPGHPRIPQGDPPGARK